MRNEFVPYDIALAMKELGFEGKTFGSWYKDGEEPFLSKDETDFNHIDLIHECKAPLYQQAFRFFREEYFIVGYVIPLNGKWTYKITSNKIKIEMNSFKSYEEAELECLRKLIEICQEKN